ncbi:MAG: carbon-nitrogen hydrolase family protein [Rhodoferax sp.]|nr:carbon-nitrogen hydrolase family protein [Rhodoferax sp.]
MHLALWQCTPLPLNTNGNLHRLDATAKEAAQSGADILVCPEMFVTGYNIGVSHVQALAQSADSVFSQSVAEIAQRHSIAIVYGYPERDRGVVFNAAQCIGADGSALLNIRKTHLFGELDRSQFAAATAQDTLFDFNGWKVGLLICYDLEFPENMRRLALAGADMVLVPTANMPDYDFVATTMVPVRAYENQVFVAYANYVGAEGEVHYGGLSSVAAPNGQVLAQAGRESELLFATVDANQLVAIRMRNTHLADARALLKDV